MHESRRSFLVAAGAAASVSRVLGANDRLGLGVIGSGPRGQYLLKKLQAVASERIDPVAVCDVYDVRRQEAQKVAGPSAEQYLDYRDLLQNPKVQAVIVATPDHWHATITVDALRAGKHVYVEKPMVHTPAEGQAIVRAAKESGRIVQVGMQGRLLPNFVEAKRRYIDSDVMGKVGMARTWYNSNSGYVQRPPDGYQQKPAGLDWDRWLGPGPRVAWNPDIYFSPYKWLHYDGGMMMGIGIHVIDSAHHWLNLQQPTSAVALGGTWFYKDGRDTPDVLSVVLEYPQQALVTFSAECLTAPGVRTSAGLEIRGTGGVLSAERYSPNVNYTFRPNSRFTSEPEALVPMPPANAEHMLVNWLDSIKANKPAAANEREGYYSAMACFLANQALQSGTRVHWKPEWSI